MRTIITSCYNRQADSTASTIAGLEATTADNTATITELRQSLKKTQAAQSAWQARAHHRHRLHINESIPAFAELPKKKRTEAKKKWVKVISSTFPCLCLPRRVCCDNHDEGSRRQVTQ